MRILLVLLAAVAAALPARGADAPAAAVHVGDTYEQVISKRGNPTSAINGGSVRMLYYGGDRVKLRNDVVVEVTAAAGGAGGAPAERGPSPGTSGGSTPAFVFQKDDADEEIDGFKTVVRGRLEARKFSELEALSAHIIAEKSLFRDGSWKILRLHEALEPSDADPDATWSAREVKIGAWEEQFPASVTARTVHLGFLAAYAWHARGAGSADSAKGFGGPLFNNRLAQAADLLQTTRRLGAKSPMLWYEGQRVALGQGWPVRDVEREFQEAKRAEPEFWHYDGTVDRFLLPKWYGREGDWEKFEEAEIQRNEGLGLEGYARAVWEMSAYYKNIFKESHAEWPWVREGYALLMGKYPDSRKLLNQYALMAVLASDRASARGAFEAMKGQADPSVWGTRAVADLSAWAGGHP